MTVRGLIVLSVVLCALVGALVFIDRSKDAGKNASPDAPLVATFTEDSVRAVETTCGGSKVTLSRSSRSWRIAKPADAEADPRRVHELLAAIQDARVKKSIAADGSQAAGFGLSPPECGVRLTLLVSQPAIVVRLGRSSPVSDERYALTDDGRVVLTDGSLYGTLARGAETFRESRLIPIDPDAITRIVLDRPQDRVVVSRHDDTWRLEAPRADFASPAACIALARAVTSLELLESAPIRPPQAKAPSRRLRVEVEAHGYDAPLVAQVAAAGIEGRRLGFRDDGTLAGVVAESAAEELERSWEPLREPRIVSFSSRDARTLEIERGGVRLRLARTAEASRWSGSQGSAAVPIDGARVEGLLEKLSGLTGDGFEPAQPVTKPTGTIVVAGVRGELARLSWGPLPSPSGTDAVNVWVTSPARPGAVFRLDARSFGPIPATAADLAPTEMGERKAEVGS